MTIKEFIERHKTPCLFCGHIGCAIVPYSHGYALICSNPKCCVDRGVFKTQKEAATAWYKWVYAFVPFGEMEEFINNTPLPM